MVILHAGIRGNLRIGSIGIAVAHTVFVPDGTHDDTPGAVDETGDVETLLFVPAQVLQRRGVAGGNPLAEKRCVIVETAALGNSAEVKSDIGNDFHYVIATDHTKQYYAQK